MDHNVTVFTNLQESVTSDGDNVEPETVDHLCGGGGRVCGREGGSIAERRAATCGFKAEKIRTARFRTSTSPLASPSVRSPCLTIPPGISPTALLDSPVMLPNAQPSPTTGTFPLPLLNQGGQVLSISNRDRCSNVAPSFTFRPQNLDSQPSFSSVEDQVSSSFDVVQKAEASYQHLVHLDTPLDLVFPAEFSKEATSTSFAPDSVTEVKLLNNIVNDNVNLGFHPSGLAGDQISMQKVPFRGQDVGTNPSEGDPKGTNTAAGTARTSEDGYNWRKYGQKQVKGSEYPRSYYKCTHPNCQVKKKVERSLDGQITEIIYKGAHNHPNPQPCCPSLGSSLSSNEMSESTEGSGTCVKVEAGLIWKNSLAGSKDIKPAPDLRADGMERTSSTSVVTDLSDPRSTAQGKSVGAFESADAPEFSSTLFSHDDDNDDRATQGSIPLCDDAANDDESESKRRKTETCLTEMNVASGALREPRVVVQIESDVDILDDGYRWRKYGQKVVKGNPNPRSYYKCTSPGCPVRKHVERASHNLKCVLTTYDGKHNHGVPAARNSSHVNSSGYNLTPTVPNTQAALALSRNANALKPETLIQDIAPPLDQKAAFKTAYMRPSFLGDFSNEMKLGTSLPSVYQMKFPSLRKAISYGSFGLNTNCIATHSSGSIASPVPNFPISMPLNLPTSANLYLAGFDINNVGKPTGPIHSFLPGQQFKDNATGFHGIKQELKDDNHYDPYLPIADHENTTSPSIYQLAAGNFPS
ncbi:WRKY DNA-binding protein 2, putative isoform 2 [Hibiscus syriacus]|uniref:WRKY DNA-binding protein 2, putative isoform 2 n=1 Tax=Hibiscus syriacus TaxID=106335 RepID=A0A6A3D321_HIBSY|nr:probable WRKY transcription factor 2 [Hibiscus syriacus]KAE8733669.1 WRKY DNA-binding protein 2, putative isoform 2 [Hibiscus syriacus]